MNEKLKEQLDKVYEEITSLREFVGDYDSTSWKLYSELYDAFESLENELKGES